MMDCKYLHLQDKYMKYSTSVIMSYSIMINCKSVAKMYNMAVHI
jgi:hypothetical protein